MASTQLTIKVVSMKRLANTKNGNPRWRIGSNFGTWDTEPDSNAISFISDNLVGRKCRAWLNDAGRIIKMEEEKKFKVTIEFEYEDYYTGYEENYPAEITNAVDATKFDLDSNDPMMLLEAIQGRDLTITVQEINHEA